MKFNGTLSDLQTSQWKETTYYRAGVVDDKSPHSERLKTEVVIGLSADEFRALEGKVGSPVTCTLRLFAKVRNGLPEFEGHVSATNGATPSK